MNHKIGIPELRFSGFEGIWESYAIGDVLKIGSGKDYKHLEKGNIPVYGTGGYMLSVNKFIHSGETVFIGRKGTIDKPFYFNGEFWTVDTLFYTYKFKNTLPLFVYGLFQKIIWKLHNEASGVPSLSKSTIEKIIVTIPTLPEQQKIASFLSAVDEKIQQLSRKKELLEQYKKGLMQQLFSGKLRFKDENGNDYADWEEKKLGDLGVFKGGGTPSTEISEYWGGDIPWISSSDLIENDISNINVTRFITEKAISESATKLIPVNSVLFISRVGVGKLAVSTREMCTSQDFANFIPNEIDSFYLAYFFMKNNNLLSSYAQGTSIKGFTSGDLKSIKVSYPVLEEQQKIANSLSSIDAKIESTNQQIAKTQCFKKGLLQQLFV
jgi:type I restriction enzyme S subunit